MPRPPHRGAFYRITRWLTFHAALQQQPKGYELDLRRLLDLLADIRRADLVPTRTASTQLDLDAVNKVLNGHEVAYSLAFQTAANLTSYFEPLDRLQLYVPPGTAMRAARLLGKGDIPVEIHQQRFESLPRTTTADGLPVTELLWTAIDVRAHPRGGAYATILEDAIRQGI